jgi:hypothetical protein
MDELIVKDSNLPSTIEDLSKFILIGREKLISIKAEIKAINKLNLAQQVRDQKKEECRMLSELLLDAEAKLGELFKQLPKIPREENLNSHTDNASEEWGDEFNEEFADIPFNLRGKGKIITTFGFSENQKQKFEVLAENKDLIEQVKKEARENDKFPTRSRVVNLAKSRKNGDSQEIIKIKYQDTEYPNLNKLVEILYALKALRAEKKYTQEWIKVLDINTIDVYIFFIKKGILKLLKLESSLSEMRNKLLSQNTSKE